MKMVNSLIIKVYEFLRMAGRSTDKTMYKLDAHMSWESLLKISAVFLKLQPKKSHFPHSVTDR